MSYRYFWYESIRQLQEEKAIDVTDYENLFSRLSYVDGNELPLRIIASSLFIRDQFEVKYARCLEGRLRTLTGEESLSLDVCAQPMPDSTFKANSKPSKKANLPDIPGLDVTESKSPAKLVLDFGDIKTKKASKATSIGLNPYYTFANYVVSGSNNFACNVAEVIAREPGKTYNPFLIYGGVGLGKTHLMQAIGHAALTTRPSTQILYVTAETFVNDFLRSIREKNQDKFKKIYRSVDLLLIDDIHDLQKKRETQEELFYTYNELYEQGKQLVFTCDRPARELRDLTDRLKSRFEMGVQADLLPPPYETRVTILNSLMARCHFHLPTSVVEFVCSFIESSVRDLEGALKQLKARAELYQGVLTVDKAREFLQTFYAGPPGNPFSIALVQRIVAKHYEVSEDDLKGKKRTKQIVFPRQIAMYLIRECSAHSTTEIGTEFGGRDHSTVMHACQKISDKAKLDSHFSAELQALRRIIENGESE